ncbi:hypothetical protein LCGC14_1353600 [marine sediment metagenome]|uniref:Uncharacterized protein n=1 Tax=marine sediment metagenome TaxID=412755 RepID=A0A0F9KAS6_9ZZZZ
MLSTALQRDTASGKLKRDTASGKLIRSSPYGDDCQYCTAGESPKQITLTVSGLSDCTVCIQPVGGGSEYYKASGVDAVLNGCVVILDQTANYCMWEKIYTNGDFGTLTHYAGANCTGPPTEYALDHLVFSVVKCAANTLWIRIGLRALLVGTWYLDAYVYSDIPWDCKVATIADCIAVNNLANSNSCGSVILWDAACENGIVTIVEGPGTHYAPPSVQYQQRLGTSDDTVQWTRSGGSNNYEMIDDPYASPDDDSTYIETSVQTNEDLYGFTIFAVPIGSTITNITIHSRCRRIDAGGAEIIRESLKVNGTVYNGTHHQLVLGAYFDNTSVWTTNPATGLAWTIDDINGIGANPLEAFGIEAIGFSKTVRATQVYAKVNYVYNW